MDRESIIRMAREAHGPITGQWWDMDAAALERFFALAYEAGATAAREACAKLCNEADKSTHPSDLADAIRARKLP
jgi:anti-sigma factor ChrR (cupin superfamily)